MLTLPLKEGVTLWFAAQVQYRKSEAVKVLKVGRKWATLSNNLRADLHTGGIDGEGFTTPGHLWDSREAHDAHVKRRAAWCALGRAVSQANVVPKTVTIDDIQAAATLLGVDISGNGGR